MDSSKSLLAHSAWENLFRFNIFLLLLEPTTLFEPDFLRTWSGSKIACLATPTTCPAWLIPAKMKAEGKP